MVQIDDKLLLRLEQLSMIEIEESKKEEIETELNRFLEFVDTLDELDLSSIELHSEEEEKSAPLRKDIPSIDTEIPETILKNAPKAIDNFFVVPKIIE